MGRFQPFEQVMERTASVEQFWLKKWKKEDLTS
jgi:hypothetical protein